MRRLLLAAVAAVGLTSAARAADKPAELALVPPAAPIAVSVDAVKLKKNLTDLGAPVDKTIAKAKEEKKIDLENISRATVFVEVFPTAEVSALPTVVVTTKEATAKADLPKWLQSETEATVAGKKAIKAKEQVEKQDFFGTIIDDKTALLGTEPALTAVFKDGAKGTDLGKEFGKADLKHDVVAVVAMKPLLAKLKEQFGDLDKLIPPAAEQFWTAAKRLETISLTVDLAEDTLLTGVFKADNAEGADLVKESLQGGVALMSLALPQIKQGLGSQLPPEAKPLISVVEAIAKTSKFKVDGSTVIMTVARPKDFGK
ncbi:hypothetical protein [Limnoglobus roseus]|uniref:DUF3352 domain-containing protein n=1 Tax=Limnoglobus roseus TaxID=2598579 RepID=A0A5C1AC69_9BACT|nr:hypothetical protein [Limnoglobus roseus]QEL15636.1 hypothetical protein PX52LOC_02570 [Limnoglobus roseus]